MEEPREAEGQKRQQRQAPSGQGAHAAPPAPALARQRGMLLTCFCQCLYPRTPQAWLICDEAHTIQPVLYTKSWCCGRAWTDEIFA